MHVFFVAILRHSLLVLCHRDVDLAAKKKTTMDISKTSLKREGDHTERTQHGLHRHNKRKRRLRTLGGRAHVVSREMSSGHDSSSSAIESNDNGIAIGMLKLAKTCSHMLEQSAKKPSGVGQLFSRYPLLKVGFMDCRDWKQTSCLRMFKGRKSSPTMC